MRALTDIKAGEQIYNDYGPLPRADLMRRYGYVTPNYAQYDVVEISTKFICKIMGERAALDRLFHASTKDLDERSIKAKLEHLETRHDYDDAFDLSWPLEGENLFPEQLLGLIAVLDLPTERLRAATDQSPKHFLQSRPRSEILTHYLDVLEARVTQYPASIDETRGTLEDLDRWNEHDVLSTYHVLKRDAFRVVLGEQELLYQACEKVRLELSSLEPVPIKTGNKSQKRPASEQDGQSLKQRKRK